MSAQTKVVVTGAGGFIGSHLVPALAAREGTSVLAVDVNFDKLTVASPGAARVERRQASLSANLTQVTGTLTNSLQNFRMP